MRLKGMGDRVPLGERKRGNQKGPVGGKEMQQVEHQTKRQLTVLQDGAPLAVRPSFAQQEEIDTFDEFVQRFRRKQISEQEFQRFRLQHGVYGQRQQGEQMFRIKIPWGGLTAEQLDVLADLAQRTPRKIGHVTTRLPATIKTSSSRGSGIRLLANNPSCSKPTTTRF